MRWNTKCILICFTKLAETSWSKKNLKRCVPKRSSKDGWRAKETFPSGSPFVTFVIRSCDMALNFDGYPELPGSTRLSSQEECRNVLVNALVKVTGTVRRSDLITSACTLLRVSQVALFCNSQIHHCVEYFWTLMEPLDSHAILCLRQRTLKSYNVHSKIGAILDFTCVHKICDILLLLQ